MLNAISWPQFATFIILCAAVWYGYIGLRFYQPKRKAASAMPPVANQMTVVMGSIRRDESTGLHDELVFGAPSADDISDQTLPKGPADELLAEAQVLAAACTEKTEFLSLFKLLLDKYEVDADQISLPGIIQSLKLPFEVKPNEWPLNFAS